MEKFQVVVVGGGPAGSAAAYVAAKAGVQVLLLERGPEVGSKTVSGGLLYTHVLRDLYGEFWAEEDPPFERWITRYVLGFLGDSSATLIDHYNKVFNEPPYNSVSVLRTRLDKWLAQKAQEAGAMVVTGTRVDDLWEENGIVKGVVSGGDQIGADITLVCDGINSLLTKKRGFRREWAGSTLGIGVKQVVELPQGTLEERFSLNGREGVEYTFLGSPKGVEGGAFLYTNRDSVSFGIILNMESVVQNKVDISMVTENFKSHPFIEKLVRGGTLVEYSACLVAEGGLNMVPRLYGDVFLVAGSAAGFVLNNGFNLRGMDFAIGSGRIAGELAAKAVKLGDTTSRVLKEYTQMLEQSFVLKHLKRYTNYPKFFANRRLYDAYPEVLNGFLHDMYYVDEHDRGHLFDVLRRNLRGKASIYNLLKDAWDAARNL
ncbi:MAG: FAD-dependent oxidoreductase [Thermoprotei archaeon]